jgi:hypothetical protein
MAVRIIYQLAAICYKIFHIAAGKCASRLQRYFENTLSPPDLTCHVAVGVFMASELFSDSRTHF